MKRKQHYSFLNSNDNKELVLGNFFKSYDHFKDKIFKGLEFKKKKEVKKYELGEKGIA